MVGAGGWDWCVLLDVCWAILVGLLGMASGYYWELPLALGHIIPFLVPVSYQIYCIMCSCKCKV